MARDPADDLRRWSGPINNLDEGERLSLFDSMLPNGRPHIEITDALRNNWFEIWYQPKIDLKRKCLAGAEALARIRHPAFGVGTILSVEPLDDDTKLIVRFVSVGQKTLRAKFAKLEVA